MPDYSVYGDNDPRFSNRRWLKTAQRIVLIDGRYLRCHGAIIDADKLVQFDALSHYNRYTDIFGYEDVQ